MPQTGVSFGNARLAIACGLLSAHLVTFNCVPTPAADSAPGSIEQATVEPAAIAPSEPALTTAGPDIPVLCGFEGEQDERASVGSRKWLASEASVRQRTVLQSELAPMATGCLTEPPADGPDLVFGLSGHYGWIGDPPVVTAALIDWFGAAPEDDPTAWQHGNPGWWLDHTSVRPSFILIGGTDDAATTDFAVELANRGFDAAVAAIENADDLNVIQPGAGPGSEAFSVVVAALDVAAR